MKDLVIVGGGFAGTWAAMSAAATRATQNASEISINLVSQSDSLCIRPRLYECAKHDMLVPLQPLMDKIGVTLIHDSVEGVKGQAVSLQNGANARFDVMVLAAGSSVNLPACEGAAEFGFAVDDFASTQKLDDHLGQLDASNGSDGTIVVVGSSFSGIEIVTKLRQRLGGAFRLVLVDRSDRPGAAMGDTLAAPIRQALDVAQVEFRGDSSPEEVTASQVSFTNGPDIKCATVVFATGFKANALTAHLSQETDPQGRLVVDDMLRVPGQKSIYAAGDVASAMVDPDHRSLMSCQHAMPMGVAAGRNAVLDLLGLAPVAYSQPFYATCIDLGMSGAVFTNGWDRTIVKSGTEGAETKQQINTQWIYPPQPSMGRDKIFEMIASS